MLLVFGAFAALPFANSIQCYSGSYSSPINCQATTPRPTTSSWTTWTYRPSTTYRPWHWHWHKPHRPWCTKSLFLDFLHSLTIQMTTFPGGTTTTEAIIGTTGTAVAGTWLILEETLLSFQNWWLMLRRTATLPMVRWILNVWFKVWDHECSTIIKYFHFYCGIKQSFQN